jgi:cell pole-organizing protein PopZ
MQPVCRFRSEQLSQGWEPPRVRVADIAASMTDNTPVNGQPPSIVSAVTSLSGIALSDLFSLATHLDTLSCACLPVVLRRETDVSDSEDDEEIRRRLARPAQRSPRGTVAEMVTRNFGEILRAHARARSEGKTWAEIGRDLRPSSPVPGNTISKAVRRIQAKTNSSAETVSTQKRRRKPAGERRSETQRPTPPDISGAFGRKVDPLRTQDQENEE